MNTPKRYMYINRFTGEGKALTKGQGKKLGEDWSRVKPAVNEKGERVLRMELNGATVDISENKAAEVSHGIGNSE